MKKTLCFVLSIVMLLSLTVIAFAAEPESDTLDPATFTENDGDYIGETQEGSERIVVRGEAWFKACRATYSGYESHYTYNSRLEGSSMGYIYGQATCPNFAIGTEYMADVGCEIAATYNALKLRGRIIPCSSIIRSFEKDGYLMKNKSVGDWGSDPYAIGDYLDDNSINYTQYNSYGTMELALNRSVGSAYDVYIISFWNNINDMNEGLHTVALYTSTSDSALYVYNNSSNSKSVQSVSNYGAIIGHGAFIVGYRIPRLRASSN